MKKSSFGIFATLLLYLTIVFSPAAQAQLRSQNKVLEFDDTQPKQGVFYDGPVLDYSSEMRGLIEKIAEYGRRFKRDFLVVLMDGKGLLTQVVDPDQLITAPSSTFMQTLDGIIEPGLFFGHEGVGIPTPKKDREDILKGLNIARNNGLKIFTLDYARKPVDIDKALRGSNQQGFIPYVAPAMGFKNNKLPNWPRHPYHENAHTISTIQKVKNYVFINDPSRFGSADNYAMKVHNTNFDMVVTNPFFRRGQVLGAHNVKKMQYKKLGVRRPVIARINIGLANKGTYYWKDSWRPGNPAFLQGLAPGSSDDFYVQFWHPSWHQILYGNTESFIYGLIQEGYDGVVLEGVDTYQVFANPQ